MMKIYKMILLAAVYISMGIGLTIFLPNLPAIDNRIHGRENVVILPEQIREVTVENAREVDTGPSGAAVLPITGCYIQCGHRKIHQIFLQTEAKLVPGVVNIYYILQAQEPYSERHCIKRKLIPWSGGYLLQIDKAPYGMRIDLADDTGNQVHLDSAMINPDRIRIAGENILPWVTFPLLLILLLYGKRKYIFTEIWQCRKMLCKLSKNDLRSKHAGMALGRVWAYIQPLLTIFVMWYVFQVGFKNPPIRKTQFIIWFMAGYLPWM